MHYEIINAFEIIILDDTLHKKLDKISPNCRIATKSRLPID